MRLLTGSFIPPGLPRPWKDALQLIYEIVTQVMGYGRILSLESNLTSFFERFDWRRIMTKICKCQWILISNALIRIKPFPNQVQISYVENSYVQWTWKSHVRDPPKSWCTVESWWWWVRIWLHKYVTCQLRTSRQHLAIPVLLSTSTWVIFHLLCSILRQCSTSIKDNNGCNLRNERQSPVLEAGVNNNLIRQSYSVNATQFQRLAFYV